MTQNSESTQKQKSVNIANKAVLITGANRGIGRALVDEALRRGAKRVYAGARGPLQSFDERVKPVTLECFDVCSNAWGSYINGSLRCLIATGTGHPNRQE